MTPAIKQERARYSFFKTLHYKERFYLNFQAYSNTLRRTARLCLVAVLGLGIDPSIAIPKYVDSSREQMLLQARRPSTPCTRCRILTHYPSRMTQCQQRHPYEYLVLRLRRYSTLQHMPCRVPAKPRRTRRCGSIKYCIHSFIYSPMDCAVARINDQWHA